MPFQGALIICLGFKCYFEHPTFQGALIICLGFKCYFEHSTPKGKFQDEGQCPSQTMGYVTEIQLQNSQKDEYRLATNNFLNRTKLFFYHH